MKVIVETIERYKEWVEAQGLKWEWKAIRGALGIEAGWIADDFCMDVLKRFLFYRRAPHLAFEGGYENQPYFWTEVEPTLDAMLGVSL